jgi:hypothetical protein
MEMSQGNSVSYLKQAKMSFSFFYKIREQEGRTSPGRGGGMGGLVPVGGRRGKGIRRYIWCKYCVHMYVNWKIPIEIVPGIGGGDIKENGGGGKWYIWSIVRTFVNATMYSHPAQQYKRKITQYMELQSGIKCIQLHGWSLLPEQVYWKVCLRKKVKY